MLRTFVAVLFLTFALLVLWSIFAPLEVSASACGRSSEDSAISVRLHQAASPILTSVDSKLDIILCLDQYLPRLESEWIADHFYLMATDLEKRVRTLGFLGISVFDCGQVSQRLLNDLQQAPSDKRDFRLAGRRGVVRVTFGWSTVLFDGSSIRLTAPSNCLEYTAHGHVSILLANIPKTDSVECSRTCTLTNIIAHGIGHAIGLADPGHSFPLFTSVTSMLLFGPFRGNDVMVQGQDPSKRRYEFNALNPRNRAIVDYFNTSTSARTSSVEEVH